jgi:hypothetical protein
MGGGKTLTGGLPEETAAPTLSDDATRTPAREDRTESLICIRHSSQKRRSRACHPNDVRPVNALTPAGAQSQ